MFLLSLASADENLYYCFRLEKKVTGKFAETHQKKLKKKRIFSTKML